ncbi:MAG: Flp pilus assembly complex ATPase component TadA, partial [Betaproteobacteria bacterium]|nr:Flp pilus assembly complex ATPase component TadA [Betaproteobacteria bacterium]
MSAVLSHQAPAQSDVGARLAFQKQLQAVTNKIHATNNIDEIMLEVSADVCALFNADRLTIYSTSEDKQSIVSKVKTGLNSFKDLKLPIAEHSIAGYVALAKKTINIKDVYDEGELRGVNPNLRFLQEVDKRTGYRTKQMLVAPIVEQGSAELIGVIQIINNKAGMPFGALTEEGVGELSQTLAIAFKQRQKPQLVKTKYDYLIADAVLSAGEFELASRQARKKALDIEQVLAEEFQVKIPAIGQALSKFFGVPYEPFKSDRIKPGDLLKNLKREYVEANHWLPIDDTKEGLVVLCLDPERIRSSRIAANVFPKARIVYKVTTQKEFKETLNQFYGQETAMDMGNIDDMLSGMEDDSGEALEGAGTDEVSAAADNELVKLVNKVIVDAYNQGASDIHIEPYPGKAKTEVRFRKDGSLGPYIEVPASYRSAIVARIKIMCDLDISEKRRPQDGKIKFKKFGPLDIELRVATIPTAGGVEDIVMRILAAGEPIPLEKMGFTNHNLDELQKAVSKPYGLFFVCGPSGSGKTATLHSVLKYLNTPDTKIWT